MKIKIDHVESAPEYITITKREYTHLTQKAGLYDDYKASQRKRGQKLTELLTPEQRRQRAIKAANARWQKQVNGESK